MKLKNISKRFFTFPVCMASCLFLLPAALIAQDSTDVAAETAAPAKVKPVKNTFQSIWIIDNQTVMVPIKGTMEWDFQHRMGLVNNGAEDLWGLYGASANIRLGVNYSPVNKLNLGIGITKNSMLLDLNAKYSIITQTKVKYPVSVTWYGNAADDTRKKEVRPKRLNKKWVCWIFLKLSTFHATTSIHHPMHDTNSRWLAIVAGGRLLYQVAQPAGFGGR